MKKTDNLTPYKASEYDDNIRKTIPFYEAFGQQTIALVESVVTNPELWVDTGCGTGALVEKALLEFPDTRFVLADPSEQMLRQAKKRLAHHLPQQKITFLEPAGSQNLSAAVKEEADVVTAIQCHHYLKKEERAAAVCACYEVLKKGGLFVTFENIRPETQKGIKIGLELWREFQLSQGRGKEEVEAHLKRFDVEYFPITVREHLELLKNSGFQTVELFWYSCMQAGFYGIK